MVLRGGVVSRILFPWWKPGDIINIPTRVSASHNSVPKETQQMNDKQLFTEICFGRQKVTDVFVRQKGWWPSRVCRECQLPIEENEFGIFITYWKAFWFPVHKACAGEKEFKYEAYLCQCIDADCNDCIHFERGPTVETKGLDGSIGKSNSFGVCGKFNKEVRACSNFCSGLTCFEHRKGPDWKP